tara:strand:- start:250 stop:1044 length:795 start_codon:yes stop_codon:yes gene_type:complete
MKKYLVVGNPIEHSLSPKLHSHWIKENNIKAIYEKRKLDEKDIKGIISDVKNEKIHGVNVTIPFKKSVIPYLDELSPFANEAQSVNTIFKKGNKIIGGNTDIGGFEKSLKNIHYDVKNKKAFILGAGGVAPSIILALKKLGASKIYLSNRTKEKADKLSKIIPGVEIIDWGKNVDFDIIINATSLGLKDDDKIRLSFNKNGPNKLFYDVIYSAGKTNFLLNAEKLGNKTETGKMMFIYQAQLSFQIWHGILPKIDDETVNLLDD